MTYPDPPTPPPIRIIEEKSPFARWFGEDNLFNRIYEYAVKGIVWSFIGKLLFIAFLLGIMVGVSGCTPNSKSNDPTTRRFSGKESLGQGLWSGCLDGFEIYGLYTDYMMYRHDVKGNLVPCNLPEKP